MNMRLSHNEQQQRKQEYLSRQKTKHNNRDNITKNVHSIIYRPFGLNDGYEGLKTYKQVLNWISIQEITIPSIKM